MSGIEYPPSFNVTVLRGVIHRLPQWRKLASGDSVTTIDLKVRAVKQRSEVVRVSWINAPTTVMDFEEGEDVVVSGRVRTYWSGRRSETDVLAACIVRARAQKIVRKTVAESMAILQMACP